MSPSEISAKNPASNFALDLTPMQNIRHWSLMMFMIRILLAGYIFQLLPALGHWIMTIIGPKRVAQYKGGGGGYDLGSMLKSTKTT